THGYIAFTAHPETPITSFTEADLEAGDVLFVHDGSDTTQVTFQVSVFDGVATSAVTTIVAAVPTVTVKVLSPNGFDLQNNDPIGLMGSGELQPTPTPATQITIVNIAANLKFVFDGVDLALDNDSNPTDIT